MEHSTINESIYQLSKVADSNAAVSYAQETPAPAFPKVSLRSIANNLNAQASTPLHDQLFSLLRAALEAGELEDVCEGRLPSLRNMSALLGLSRETVAKAIAKLAGYGYLSAEERKRIYVMPRKGIASQYPEQIDSRSRSVADVVADEESDADKGRQLDFRPPLDESVATDGYGKNYLTDRYLKTLRRQSSKRSRVELDSCGLASFREVLCQQLQRDSELEFRAENVIVFSDFRSCADFIFRLTTKGRSTCVMEAPGCPEIKSILDISGHSVVEIPVDEEGMRVDILSSYGLAESVCFISPSMHDPLGVRLSPQRTENLINWSRLTNSVIFEHSGSQGFLRLSPTPLLWRASSIQGSVFAWTITSALKPWAQTCCAVFSNQLIEEARRLKSAIGGDVSISEQLALQDFILDGDLLRAQRQRELVNLEKRRRISLALTRMLKGAVGVWRGNCGPKLVFEVGSDVDLSFIAEALRKCGMPVRLLDEFMSSDQTIDERRLVLELDMINTDAISNKIDALESMLAARGVGGIP